LAGFVVTLVFTRIWYHRPSRLQVVILKGIVLPNKPRRSYSSESLDQSPVTELPDLRVGHVMRLHQTIPSSNNSSGDTTSLPFTVTKVVQRLAGSLHRRAVCGQLREEPGEDEGGER
jgi:hypothetical protein